MGKRHPELCEDAKIGETMLKRHVRRRLKKHDIIDFENSVNIKVQKANHLAQFFQTLCMLSLTLVVGGYFLLQNGFWFLAWTAICLILAAVSFILAIDLGLKALNVYCSTPFEISNQRLGTLDEIKIPADVMFALGRFRRGHYIGEGRFFYLVAKRVGTERCAEFRDKIFKYLKVD